MKVSYCTTICHERPYQAEEGRDGCRQNFTGESPGAPNVRDTVLDWTYMTQGTTLRWRKLSDHVCPSTPSQEEADLGPSEYNTQVLKASYNYFIV